MKYTINADDYEFVSNEYWNNCFPNLCKSKIGWSDINIPQKGNEAINWCLRQSCYDPFPLPQEIFSKEEKIISPSLSMFLLYLDG